MKTFSNLSYNLILLILISPIISCANSKYISMDRTSAQEYLNKALQEIDTNKKLEMNYIKDERTAVEIAQIILKSIYGKENIEKQEPFRVALLNNYWIIAGSHQEGDLGGVAIIIMSKKTGQIIMLTHGK